MQEALNKHLLSLPIPFRPWTWFSKPLHSLRSSHTVLLATTPLDSEVLSCNHNPGPLPFS